jgi:hypothetical protein
MATAKSLLSPFRQISLHPLVGNLDTRSRPADIPPGAFRWKLNLQTTVDAKLCRRSGFDKFIPNGGPADSSGNALMVNQDLHAQGATRNPISFLFENTTNAGLRQLFAGTQDSLWLLNATPGTWTSLVTGVGAPNARWRADTLQDLVFFANGVNPPSYYDGTSFNASIPNLSTEGTAFNMTGINAGQTVANALIVIQFCGVLLWMNITGTDGTTTTRYPTKIFWSNLNQGLVYAPYVDENGNGQAVPNPVPTGWSQTVCGFQDLPYGDEIIGAIPLLGNLYIFTRRGIWRMSPVGVSNGNITASGTTGSNIWGFTQIYSEPKNQTGCLIYPFSLVSTGQDIYYMSREAIYKYNPYMVAPERTDWLYRAAGVMYKTFNSYVDPSWCNLPSAEYTPNTGELWFSWPSYNNNLANRNDDDTVVLNNWSLVACHDQKTADVLDCGFSAFVNFRDTPIEGTCNESQDFLGASTMDYCIKSIGGPFYRAYLTGSTATSGYVPSADNEVAGVSYEYDAYNSLFRVLIPTGYFDQEKLVRLVHLEDDTTEEAIPCLLTVRVGQSYSIQDPNEGQSPTAPEAIGDSTCAVLWQPLQALPLACSDPLSMSQMAAQNLAPAQGKDYPVYIQNRYLYCEVGIIQPPNRGTMPSAGDVCLEQCSFDVQGLPKV